MKGILGRKLGMTQVFASNGTLIPVTVIECEPNVVLQKKEVKTDGYDAIQLGFEAGVSPKRFIREIRADEMMNLEVGQEVKVDLFSAGDIVDVTGISKGHGYTGTIARYNAQRGPVSHGGSKNIRHIGSLASTGRNNGRIEKNTPMPGHDGVYTTTNQNLEVIKVDADQNYILVKGNVPGPKKGMVMIKTTAKPVKHVAAKELLDRAPAEEKEA